MNAKDKRLEALLKELLRTSDADLRLLRLSWDEVPGADRAAAWQVVKRVVQRDPGKSLMEDGRSRLAEWVNNSATWTGFGFGEVATSTGSGMNMADVRRAALPALLDAVAALIAEDDLTDDQRAALLEPWSSIAQHESA
jgi:hypothetical protein